MKTTKTIKLTLLIVLSLVITSVNSQVVLNEVMAYPSGSQGIIVYGGNSGNEYVELYNPTCSAVDVSGYFIGSRQDFAGNISGGGFRIPNVTVAIIPPNGHLVIGTSTSSSDPNSIDIKTSSYTSNYCQNSTSNFILANADGWVGLYNAAGVPIDAIYWSSNAANISNAGDYTGTPCVPTGSPTGVGLESAQQINSGYPGVLNYVGNTTSIGKTFSRIPDGGAWDRNITASVNDLTVGNCNGGACITSTSFAITSTEVQPTCGNPNGSITINPTTAGTYTYVWTPNVSSTNSATALAAGIYSIHIDKNGCTKDTTITLTNSSYPTAILSTPTNPSCGSSNGQVVLGAVTGGVAPYQYNFNGLGYSSTASYTNLTTGSYTLVVQDNNGCSYTAPNIVLTAGNGPSAISITTTNETCTLTNGQVSLGTVTGGSSPYQYNFNGLGFSANIDYSNLAAGTYSLVVQDNTGCSFIASPIILVNISGPTAVNITSTNETCSLSNGTITLGVVTGGTSIFQYNFNGLGFSSTTTYSNLIAGTYTLTIQDQNGCTLNVPPIILSNTTGPTEVTVTGTNSTCNLNNGELLIGAVTGGLAPYQFNFNALGYSILNNYQNLATSSYTLSIQDGNGCIYNAPPVIIANTPGPSDLEITSTDATCDLKNGEISINNTLGGLVPYTYSIDGINFTNILTYNNFLPGNYTITVQDGNGCKYSEDIFINNNPPPIANFNFSPAVIKNEKEDVKLTDESSGSIISYEWYIPDGSPNSGSTQNFNTKFLNFAEGFYPITLIVTNEYGCYDTVTKYIERRIDPIIYVPNTFTPDGDKHNNSWQYALTGLDLNSFNMKVFNRWGEIVWETYDQKASWDGVYKGKIVQSGTYTWVMNAKDNIEDKHMELVGCLNIIY